MFEKDINTIFINIENYSHKKIDRKILTCAMSFVYHAGLQRNEIPILTIGDVYDQNRNVRNKIIKKEMKKGEMIIPADIHNELKEYYDYLDSHEKHSTTDNDPLFPGYDSDTTNTANAEKRIWRHLKKINPEYNELIHDLHELGIKGCWQRSKNPANALTDTAKQFRISETSAQASIDDKITSHGMAKPAGAYALFLKTAGARDKVIFLDYSDIKNIKDAIDEAYDGIKSSPDKGLNASGESSKINAFKHYLKWLMKEWK